MGRSAPKGGDSRRSSPPGNHSVGSVTHHRTDSLPLQTPWLTPSFTSQVSLKVGTPPHIKRASHRGLVLLLLLLQLLLLLMLNGQLITSKE